jgi:Domain of unknown function (DUF4160)
MPRLATFARFALYMYANDHGVPHVHIESAAGRASIAIADGWVIRGDVPAAMVREAGAWIAQHRDELIERWKEMHE